MPTFQKKTVVDNTVIESDPAPQEVAVPTKTDTNWEAFAKAGLVPVHITCELYTPTYHRTGGCHSALLINSATLRKHSHPDHCGGFRMFLRKTDGKPSPLWADLATSGLEATDLLCEVCGQPVRLTPAGIAAHAKPHSGETRQSWAEMRRKHPTAVLGLRLSLGQQRTEDLDQDIDEFNQ